MSYVPQPGYGATGGHQPYLDTATITQQEKDATTALNGQADMQLKMIGHQYSHQVDMIKAECERNVTMAVNQFQQERDPAIMELEQQQKQQEMQLTMAKQQRVMAISQQAAQMQAQASQMQMQMDMQKKMASLYHPAGMGAGAGKSTGGTDKPAATKKKA